MPRIWKKKKAQSPEIVEATVKTLNDVVPTASFGNSRAWLYTDEDYPIMQAWVIHQPNFSEKIQWFLLLLNRLGTPEEMSEWSLRRLVPNANVEMRLAFLGMSPNEVPNVESLPQSTTVFVGQLFSTEEYALTVLKESVFSVLQGNLNPVDPDRDMWVLRFGTISASSYPMAFKPMQVH